MKTEVLMKRELFGHEITQKSKSEFFSATDIVRYGNYWRTANQLPSFNFSAYLNSKSTKEFIEELERKYGNVIIKGRGRSAHTWVHPLLFIDIALSINPKLKVEVYEWLFDNLIRYRNDSGDSYREMSAALYSRFSNHKRFPEYIQKVASHIKQSLKVRDWQSATEEQLKKRDLIHHSIKLLSNVLTDTDQIVRIAVKENL